MFHFLFYDADADNGTAFVSFREFFARDNRVIVNYL